MTKKNVQRGFTLIELLIVIVIIGILAGVLIAVINPVQQQNRAKDATLQSSLNKMTLVGQSHVSAYGRAPTAFELFQAIDNETAGAGPGDCTNNDFTGDQICSFTVDGSDLPLTCDVDNWRGSTTGAAACEFRYYRPAAWPEDRFRIYAKSWGLGNRVFVVDNMQPGMFHCDAAQDVDAIDDFGTSASCERFAD